MDFWKSWFSGFDRFKTQNKHHHLTQRGRLPLPWPILGSFDQFSVFRENAYKLRMDKASEFGLAQIEREKFSLSNGYIRGRNKYENVFRILSKKYHKLHFWDQWWEFKAPINFIVMKKKLELLLQLKKKISSFDASAAEIFNFVFV